MRISSLVLTGVASPPRGPVRLDISLPTFRELNEHGAKILEGLNVMSSSKDFDAVAFVEQLELLEQAGISSPVKIITEHLFASNSTSWTSLQEHCPLLRLLVKMHELASLPADNFNCETFMDLYGQAKLFMPLLPDLHITDINAQATALAHLQQINVCRIMQELSALALVSPYDKVKFLELLDQLVAEGLGKSIMQLCFPKNADVFEAWSKVRDTVLREHVEVFRKPITEVRNAFWGTAVAGEDGLKLILEHATGPSLFAVFQCGLRWEPSMVVVLHNDKCDSTVTLVDMWRQWAQSASQEALAAIAQEFTDASVPPCDKHNVAFKLVVDPRFSVQNGPKVQLCFGTTYFPPYTNQEQMNLSLDSLAREIMKDDDELRVRWTIQ